MIRSDAPGGSNPPSTDRIGERVAVLAAVLLAATVPSLQSWDSARLDAHTEVYAAQGLSLVTGLDGPTPGPRIGPLPGWAGPIGLWPYVIAGAFGGGAEALLAVKALCWLLGLGALAMAILRATAGRAAVGAGLAVLGLGLSAWAHGEALNLRPTAYLPLPLGLGLYGLVEAARPGVTRRGFIWLCVAGLCSAVAVSTHLLAAPLGLGVAALGVVWWRRGDGRVRARLAAAGVMTLLLCLPLILGIARASSAGAAPQKLVGGAGLDWVTRITRVVGQLVPRGDASLMSGIGWLGSLGVGAGLVLLLVQWGRRNEPSSGRLAEVLLALVGGAGLTVGLLAAAGGAKEQYFHAAFFGSFAAGATGLSGLSRWSAVRRWGWMLLVALVVVGATDRLLTAEGAAARQRGNEGQPPSARLLDAAARAAAGAGAGGLPERRLHTVLTSSDASMRYFLLAESVRSPHREVTLAPGQHVLVGSTGAPTTVLAAEPGRPAPEQDGATVLTYRPVVRYEGVVLTEGERRCFPRIPWTRTTLDDAIEVAFFGQAGQAPCADGTGGAGYFSLHVPLRAGSGGELNLVLGAAGGQPGVTAWLDGQRLAMASWLPRRWPQHAWRVTLPDRAGDATVELRIEAPGINHLELF